MINLLKQTEIEYIKCFSKETKTETSISFWDEKFEDFYGSNLTMLTKKSNEREIIEIINKEITLKRRENRDFLLFELDGEVTEEVIKHLSLWPSRIDKLDYMTIETKEYKNINYREDCLVKEVNNPNAINDLIRINILDYAQLVGKSYANRRIRRKVNVYKDLGNHLTSFISYLGNEAVGSCEILVNENIAKIEDFGILLPYQNRGVGKSILHKVLNDAHNKNVKIAYVVTESNGIAKEIYEKYGFKKVGEKTQLIFSF